MADQITFLPIIKERHVEHTQATYYTSKTYPKPLTPKHILGNKDYHLTKHGTI